MTRHRFFINKEQIRNESVFLSGTQARQIHQVLRFRTGDKIFVLNNEGWEFEVELQSTRPDKAIGRVVMRWRVESEPRVHLTLIQSLLKQDRFEWILQKGTELGVGTFVPMITERSVIREAKLKQNKLARWQRIICEAAEQSGRGFLPTLAQPTSFNEAIKEAEKNQLAMIPWTGEKTNSIPNAITNSMVNGSQPILGIALFLGPEGGFSASEIEAAQAARITPITLGPRILRAETAAIAATTITMHEIGEMDLPKSNQEDPAKE